MPSYGEKGKLTLFRTLFFFLYLFLFTAAPGAYGSSLASGVKSELQLPAYTIATATPDPSHICDYAAA